MKWVPALAALALAVLACTCGGTGQLGELAGNARDVAQTARAVATQVDEALPTLQIVATQAVEMLPTIQAAGTRAAEVMPTLEAGLTQAATLMPDLPAYGEQDGLPTEQNGLMFVGETKTGTFSAANVAHNYVFLGELNSTVTIRVSSAETSFTVKLFDLTGAEVMASGGGPGSDVLLTYTVTTAGPYTLRLASGGAGAYTLEVRR